MVNSPPMSSATGTPLRVVMIDPSLFTPPYDDALGGALIGLGHEVRLVGRPPREDDPPLSGTLPLEPIYYRRSERVTGPLRLAAKGVGHLWGGLELLRRLREWKPHVVHFQWCALPLIDEWLVRLIKRASPVVLTVHDLNLFHGGASSKLQLLRWKSVLHLMDGLVAHTEASAAALVEGGVPKEKVFVIPHGVLRPVNDGSRAMPKRGFEVLQFGQIQEYKGADLLIEAMARLPDEVREQVWLTIAGRPKIPTEPLEQLVVDRGLSDRVELQLGFVPDEAVNPLFERADVIAFPYREIDASGALMLALGYGKAVVATRVGMFVETLAHEESALLVGVEDPDAIAAAITRLVKDPALCERLGRGALAAAEGSTSWASIAGQTEAMYRQLMA